MGITSYSAELRSQLRRVAEQYQVSLSHAREVGTYELTALDSLTAMYFEKQGTETLLLSLLKYNPGEAYAYFDQKDAVMVEELHLLNNWKPEFLQKDMHPYLTKHEAAGKKFFGKANAMAMVTAEIQTFANRQLSYEQIPSLLQMIIAHQGREADLQKAYNALSDITKNLIKQLSKKS